MSVAEKVDDLNAIKESFARAEKLAEEVISLRNEVIGLSKKKELSREGWRAIQKMEPGKPVWLSLGSYDEISNWYFAVARWLAGAVGLGFWLAETAI